jgi:hypothetical protein
MACLSSAYITYKLSAACTTPATRDLIFAFLTATPNATAIAGIEPVEGPVIDDRTNGCGDQVRDYAIGLAVAPSIIAKRNTLGGFTDLTPPPGRSHSGADKPADLIFPFTRGNLTITVAHAGEEPVDVAAIAKRLDGDLTEPSTARELKAERANDASPKPLQVGDQKRAQLMERLPEPVLRNGWLKVIVPDGEIARESDALGSTRGTRRLRRCDCQSKGERCGRRSPGRLLGPSWSSCARPCTPRFRVYQKGPLFTQAVGDA